MFSKLKKNVTILSISLMLLAADSFQTTNTCSCPAVQSFPYFPIHLQYRTLDVCQSLTHWFIEIWFKQENIITEHYLHISNKIIICNSLWLTNERDYFHGYEVYRFMARRSIHTKQHVISKILKTCYFAYFGHAWPHQSKMIV